MNLLHKREIFYSGHVQGVGFRYQVLQIAKEFEVSGTVQNLSDGRVHLVAEGRAEEVTAFTEEIESEMESYIKEQEVTSSEAPASLTGFRII